MPAEFDSESGWSRSYRSGKPRAWPILVTHGAHRLLECGRAQNRTSVRVTANTDGPCHTQVARDEVILEAETGDARRRADEESGRHRVEEDEEVVDDAIVISGIRHPIGTVVVIESKVERVVCLLQDLLHKAIVPALLPGLSGDIAIGIQQISGPGGWRRSPIPSTCPPKSA